MRVQAVVEPESQESPWEESEGFTRLQWIGIGLAVTAIAAAVVFLPVALWLRIAVQWTSELGWVGMLLFIALYAIAATLAVPVTPLNIGAGVLFGWWLGFLLALGGGVAAAVLSLLIARFLLQDFVRRWLADRPTPKAIIEDVHENPWSAIITFRLHPFLPASVKNYMFGISDVRLRVYAAATAIAYAPVVFIYAYLGAAGYMTVEQDHEWTTATYVLYGLAVIAALSLTVVLTWYGKRRIDEIKRRHSRARGAHSPAANA